MNLAKPGIQANDRVCIMEDTWTLSPHSARNRLSVAGMGTATPLRHGPSALAQIIWCMTRTRQDKGQPEDIDVFREAGDRASVVTYDGAKDPDEFLKTRGPAFRRAPDEALTDINSSRDSQENGRRFKDGRKNTGEEIMVPSCLFREPVRGIRYTEEFSRELGVRKESLDKDVELYRRRARQEQGIKSQKTEILLGNNQPEQGVDRGSSLKAGDGRSDGEIPLVRRKAEEGVIRCRSKTRITHPCRIVLQFKT